MGGLSKSRIVGNAKPNKRLNIKMSQLELILNVLYVVLFGLGVVVGVIGLYTYSYWKAAQAQAAYNKVLNEYVTKMSNLQPNADGLDEPWKHQN